MMVHACDSTLEVEVGGLWPEDDPGQKAQELV
jgi:hypothetical protein